MEQKAVPSHHKRTKTISRRKIYRMNNATANYEKKLSIFQRKHKKNRAAVALGRLGGKTKGKTKARTREQAQKAALAMWAKKRAAKQ
jgi:hypothetical protein